MNLLLVCVGNSRKRKGYKEDDVLAKKAKVEEVSIIFFVTILCVAFDVNMTFQPKIEGEIN